MAPSSSSPTPDDVFTVAPPPRWVREDNPDHPNYDWIRCTVPQPGHRSRVKRFPRDQEETAIQWGLARWAADYHKNPDAQFAVAVSVAFTYDPRDPHQVAALERWRHDYPTGLVRTLTAPDEPIGRMAPAPVRAPDVAWNVTAMAEIVPELETAQERRAERDREALWDALWGRASMHTTDYAGTYHGQMLRDRDLLRSFPVDSQQPAEDHDPDRALAPKTTPANVRADQWAQAYRLVEAAPDQWAVAVLREATHGTRRFTGFLPDPRQKTGAPIVFASVAEGVAYLTAQAEQASTMRITAKQAARYHVPMDPGASSTVITAEPAVLETLAGRWEAWAKPHHQVSSTWQWAFAQQCATPEVTARAPRV